MPPAVFENLRQEWSAALPALDCESDNTFCQVAESCASAASKLKPVGFQFSDYVFELAPELYLYTGSASICYFVVHKCRLPGDNANLFLVGDVFLRHFYSVYDFDKDQLGLGVNVHSQGRVALYKPGARPADAQDAATSAELGDEDDEDVELTASSGQASAAKSTSSSLLQSDSKQ